jgi:hypothetical protein
MVSSAQRAQERALNAPRSRTAAATNVARVAFPPAQVEDDLR